MKVDENNPDKMTLSSGRQLNANCGIVGISPGGMAFGGYDQGLMDDQDEENPLTRKEREELAEFMIRRWQAFAQAEPNQAQEF